jgi:hypothetical protein
MAGLGIVRGFYLRDDAGEMISYDGETPEGFLYNALKVFHLLCLLQADLFPLRRRFNLLL